MKKLNAYLTVARWAWVRIDAPRTDAGKEFSRSDKARLKLRPYWQIVSPLKVVDWFIDAAGVVQWVLYEDTAYEAADPLAPAVSYKYRELWRDGKVTRYRYGDAGTAKEGKIVSQETVPLTYSNPAHPVPWVLAGEISAEPHWFDSCESVSRTILDLESCNRQNFFNTVFPQPYLPASVIDMVKQNFQVDAEKAVSMVMGYNYPILLGPDDPTPGYIMPDAAATGSMGEELKRLRKELFDSIGLMVMQETRAVASGESRAFDHNEVAQVMSERAGRLEDTERAAASITAAWDTSLTPWQALYARDYKIQSASEIIEPLTKALNVSMPAEMQRFTLSQLFEGIKRAAGNAVTPELEQEIADAIAVFEPSAEFDLMVDDEGAEGA